MATDAAMEAEREAVREPGLGQTRQGLAGREAKAMG